MAVLKAIEDEWDVETYPLFHATRADFLSRLGFQDQAAAAYQAAAVLTAPTYLKSCSWSRALRNAWQGLGQMLDNISRLTVIARTWTRIMTGMTSLERPLAVPAPSYPAALLR
ncbi:hypothetical protein LNP74_33775 [Klebsiella pneumoniae subsp. pneumoniae]|nr:hypothetical protein [Klebsiella pneumoniae subsp. pneumoniae]